MYDDMMHEIAHSIESPLGYFIYEDQKIKEEFVKINQDQEQRINEKFEEQNANIENQLKSAG